MSADYKGKDYVASVTMGNVNPVTDSGEREAFVVVGRFKTTSSQ